MPQPTMLDLAPSLQEPGKRLVDTGELKLLFASLFDVIQNVTATGVSYMTSPVVTGGFVWVTSGDGLGISLGNGAMGQQMRIFADVPGSVTVWAPVPGQIIGVDENSTVPGTFVNLGGGQCGTFVCIAQGVWKQVS